MSGMTRLEHLRSEIERVTICIIDLVGQRNSLAHDVALEKARLGGPLIAPNVESYLRALVSDRCMSAGVDTGFGLRLLNQLMDESIRLQKETLRSERPFDDHEVFTRAKDLEDTGKRVIHLEVGEPDFGPPAVVLEAMTEAVAKRLTHYTQSAGILALREKISETLSPSHNAVVSPDEVIVTVSGRYALFLGIASTLKAGDEAIIIDPSFPAYCSCVRAVGGRPVRISTELDKSWFLDVDVVHDHINQSTRLIILNSPSNPTGKILNEQTCRDLAELAAENDICILSDEVYSAFSYSPFTSFLELPICNHIVVKSFSKPYGMTGFRLGYAISSQETVKKMARIQSLQLTCAPEFIQHAGMAALDCEEEVNRNATTIRSRLLLTNRLLEELPVSFKSADGGFYIFVKLGDKYMDGVEFAEKLLSEKGVCVMPGIVYGAQYDSFFRISVCQSEDRINEGLGLMGEMLR